MITVNTRDGIRDIKHPTGVAWRLDPDGALYVLAGSEGACAVYAPGTWLSVSREPSTLITIDASRLTWDGRVPTARELTEWIEMHTPAGEFSTGLLIVADALRARGQASESKP